MIRFIIGLILVMGVAGGLDNPENPLLPLIGFAVLGFALMYSSTKEFK